MTIGKKLIAWILSIAALLLLAAIGAYLVTDNATVAAQLIKRLQAASGTHISYRQDATISRTWAPLVTLNDIVIEDMDRRFVVTTSRFELQLSLPALLLGRLDVLRLVLGDTRVDIKESNAPGKQSLSKGLPLAFDFRDIQISPISVGFENEEISLPGVNLKQLAVRSDPGSGNLVLSLQTMIADKKVYIVINLPGMDEIPASQQLPFSLAAEAAAAQLLMEGSVDMTVSPPTVHAQVSGDVFNVEKALTGITGVPIQGEISVKALVTGNLDQLAMEKISGAWNGSGQSHVQLSGRVANIIELTGFDFDATGEFDKPTWLSKILPTNPATLEKAEFTTRVSGSFKKAEIRECIVQVKTTDQLDLSLTGNLDLTNTTAGRQLENIDLQFDFSAPTTSAAGAMLFESVPELGPIHGKASIRSTNGDLRLEGIEVALKDESGIQVDVNGRIAEIPLNPARSITGYDLGVRIKAADTSTMGERFAIPLPVYAPLNVTFRIEGDTHALHVNDIALLAGDNSGVLLRTTGHLQFGRWDSSAPLQNIDLAIELNGRNTISLGKALGKQLPELGGFTARASVNTSSGKHLIDSFSAQIGEGSPLSMSLVGSLGQLTLSPRPTIDGIRLDASATAADIAQLNDIVPLNFTIPAIGGGKAQARISGSDQEIAISGLTLTTEGNNVGSFTVAGRLGDLSAVGAWQLRNTDLTITVDSGSGAVAEILGYSFPDVGDVTGKARLFEKAGQFSIENANVILGAPDDPIVVGTGHIADLVTGDGSRFEFNLDLAPTQYAGMMENDTSQLPDFGHLVGNILIADTDGSMGIDSLNIKNKDEPQINVNINGRFDDFEDIDTLSITARMDAPDLQVLGALFSDMPWPVIGPVTLDSRMVKGPSGNHFNTELIVGDIQIDAVSSIQSNESIPLVTAKISARNFFLPEMFEQFAGIDKDLLEPALEYFSRQPIDLAWLKEVYLDLSVDIESFDDKRSNLESAQLKIALDSSQLTVGPASFVYPKGKVDIDVQLDADAEPRLSVKVFGKDINPWQALTTGNPQVENTIDAELDVDIDITSSGVSQHELVSNLAGGLYLYFKNGRMPKEPFDMLFVDLVGWSMSKAIREKYIYLDCGVADYSVKGGLISTNAFFVDAKSITIVGEGKINLADEQIDYVFLPRKKTRLVNSAEPVRITGTLREPTVSAIPWRTAVKTYGGLLFAPQLLAGRAAFDLLTGTSADDKSPCDNYEQKYKLSQETDVKETVP